MIFTRLFQLMAEKKASDIFVSVGAPIHIKIQGVVTPLGSQKMDADTVRKMAYELMDEEQIKAFETNLEMNLGVRQPELGSFRVNIFRQRGTISIVVRYVSSEIPPFDSLGLPPVLKEVVMAHRGLILVVGATGSGKSTTLAAMLDHRNENSSGHILTLEDPIEYAFRHKKSLVNQREVGLDTRSFQDALKNALRQAPNCILIGEIRDRETMAMGLTYAQSGHLCLATLHANNAYHAMNRIINFYALENRPALFLDLSVSLKCVIAQRLVRGVDGKRLPAVEVLMNSRHIAELIEKGEVNQIKEAMEQSLYPGNQTFEQALYQLYREGKVSMDEALANADSPTNLSWLINNAGEPPKHEMVAKSEQAEVVGTTTQPDFNFSINVPE